MDSNERAGFTLTGIAIFIFGIFAGIIINSNVTYKHDTYFCTVDCQDNARSIRWGGACYCKE